MRYVFIVILILLFYLNGCQKQKAAEEPTAPGAITVTEGEKGSEDAPFEGYTVTGERRVNFAPFGEENDTTKMLGALATVRNTSVSSAARRLAEKDLGKAWLVRCAPCHDSFANGVIGPALINKTPQEIESAIEKYRAGNLTNPLMERFIGNMSKEEIKDMAERVARFNQSLKEAGLD